ncbi:hypothetical protein FJY63_06505, partial [Candidatus Sumerlaeota bacterium]|nr:hypothetical protein [Candidatus Sumerlaeota bacterium]
GPYRLFAANQGESAEQWARPVPITVRAMVLADKALFLAGPRVDAGGGPEGREGALLLAVSPTDGADIAQYTLDCAPVFDGMAAANKQLYLSTLDGRVICFAAKQ